MMMKYIPNYNLDCVHFETCSPFHSCDEDCMHFKTCSPFHYSDKSNRCPNCGRKEEQGICM